MVFLTALVSAACSQSFIEQDALLAGLHPGEDAGAHGARLSGTAGAVLVAQVSEGPDRVRSIEQWQQVLRTIERRPGVLAATPTVAGSAFASRGRARKSVAIRGVVEESFATSSLSRRG